jgi:hypothetical protein
VLHIEQVMVLVVAEEDNIGVVEVVRGKEEAAVDRSADWVGGVDRERIDDVLVLPYRSIRLPL